MNREPNQRIAAASHAAVSQAQNEEVQALKAQVNGCPQ